MSPPWRTLPQRSWAASIPTLVTHDALERLVTPCVLPGEPRVAANLLCPLERFLGCVVVRKHMQRQVHVTDDTNTVSARHGRQQHGKCTSRTEATRQAYVTDECKTSQACFISDGVCLQLCAVAGSEAGVLQL